MTDIFNTTRLTITFGNVKIGADIEPNTTLLQALKEIIKSLEETNNETIDEMLEND